MGYTEVDPQPDFEDVIMATVDKHIVETKMGEPEPLPDVSVTKTRGRPTKSASDAAKERDEAVRQVKESRHDVRQNELTRESENTYATSRTV